MAKLGWLRRPPRGTPDSVMMRVEAARPRAVRASAVPVTGPDGRAAWAARRGDTAWQKEAWYFYDAVGELRSAVNWIANAVSRADVYAAEVDPETGRAGEATEDARVQAAVATCLGGASTRAQLQYTLAVNWQIPGEAFALIRPRPLREGQPQPDEWLILSGGEVDEQGGKWTYVDPITGKKTQIKSSDLLIRIWSPHPRVQSHADSAIRPALPVLREIEKSSQNIAARLDSRLAGNGIMFVPSEVDFPATQSGSTGAPGLVEYIMDAITASLSNPGQAAAQAPLVVTVPGELIGQIQHIDFATAFDAAVVELRTDGLKRLAESLDMPNEIATGTMGSANHWSSWQIEETSYKIYVEPLLDRIGDAFATYWLHPLLRRMGVTDPERFALAWDTTEIVSRPNRLEEIKGLYELDLVTGDYVRSEAGVPEDAVPSKEEADLRRLERIVIGAPTLAADPEIARRLFGFEISPAAAGVSESDIEGAPALPAADPPPDNVRSLPTAPEQTPPGLVAAAELVVFDALSRAGGRLLTRQYRGQFGHVAKHDLYRTIPFETAETDRLIDDSFQFSGHVASAFSLDPGAVTRVLTAYTRDLIGGRLEHKREWLAERLRTLL